ncbi:stress-response A/B barrel domain-containing protein UP3-like [Diospyros lotus]|uniref:stress-response A/B barrel domain-containing protein UP3-like n=1 Tax=Diospyros lotus TaxID=55363 RepID=UPI0022577BA8|nr:stress-response A/B barrel domain-containing protein UP3-like [Diospyros lotus]
MHPEHLKIVRELGDLALEDIVAVDWVCDGPDRPAAPPPGSAVRATLLKLKDGLGDKEKREVLGAVGGIAKSCCGASDQITLGENFSPAALSKGFSIGLMWVSPDDQLKGLEPSEVARLMGDKVEIKRDWL